MSYSRDFLQTYNSAIEKLDNRQLGEALKIIHKLVNATKNWQLLDELEGVGSAYSLLLEYMVRGVVDPERKKQRLSFLRSCYEIADRAACLERNNGQDFKNIRNVSRVLKDLEDLGLKSITSSLNYTDRQKHLDLYSELFDISENAVLWNAEMRQQAEEVMNSALVSDNDKIVMAAGLMLSTLYAFDAVKVNFFASQYCNAENPKLRIQLLLALILSLLKYRKRLSVYSDVLESIALLNDVPEFAEDIAVLQITMLECLGTQDVKRKLHDEIIPSMLKGKKFNPFDISSNKIDDINEFNPEWISIDKSMGELARLEAKGADVYFATFSSLKHFPFFDVRANWFYPYDSTHVSIPQKIREAEQNGIMSALLNSENLCDSDKYSFCLLTSQINEQQLQLLASQIPGVENVSKNSQTTREDICRNALRNLYRYFYVFNGEKPSNPFVGNISFIDVPYFSKALGSSSVVSRVSSYAIEKKEYDLAIKYIDSCSKIGNDESAELYQKLGYCYQKKKMYSDAMSAYGKANEMDGSSVWTLRHLAQTNLYLGNYKEALAFFRTLETKKQDDASVAFRCGECLAKMGEYSEAIKCFFKAEYIEPSNVGVLRAIAWYSVLTDDLPQARKYYDKVLSAQPVMQDYICAGHIAWISGNLGEAYQLYMQAAKQAGSEEFSRSFFADSNVLKSHGISEYDAQLVVDMVILKNR